MSTQPPEGQHVEGGIFTPWDKILERIERQYEMILAKLDSKVETSTFQTFQSTYESRHDRLIKQVDENYGLTAAHVKKINDELSQQKHVAEEVRQRWIPQIQKIDDRLQELEDERLSRDAIKQDRKVLYFGGGLMTIIVTVNLLWNIVQGGGAGVPGA